MHGAAAAEDKKKANNCTRMRSRREQTILKQFKLEWDHGREPTAAQQPLWVESAVPVSPYLTYAPPCHRFTTLSEGRTPAVAYCTYWDVGGRLHGVQIAIYAAGQRLGSGEMAEVR